MPKKVTKHKLIRTLPSKYTYLILSICTLIVAVTIIWIVKHPSPTQDVPSTQKQLVANPTSNQPLITSFQNIPTTNAINPNDTAATTGWKFISSERKTMTFTYKYPSEWKSLDDNCTPPPGYKGLDLAPGCTKVVIFTENIPKYDDPLTANEVELLSKTKTIIQGYTVIREIYTHFKNNTPDTYQAWFFDNGKPFMLVLGYIGLGTNSQTANYFVNVFDKGVGSIQFQRK